MIDKHLMRLISDKAASVAHNAVKLGWDEIRTAGAIEELVLEQVEAERERNAKRCHWIGRNHEDAHTRTAELCEDAITFSATEDNNGG